MSPTAPSRSWCVCEGGERKGVCKRGACVGSVCDWGGARPQQPLPGHGECAKGVQRACKGDKKQGGVQKGDLCGVCV